MTVSGDMVASAKRRSVPSPRAPRERHVVVTCMDARIDPLTIFGAGVGDLHLIRNAGGIITDDVLRSILLSQVTLGTIKVSVVMHTDCGLLGIDDDTVLAETEVLTGHRPRFPLGGFDDLGERLTRSMEMIRECGFLPHRDQVSGSIYNVETRELHRIF